VVHALLKLTAGDAVLKAPGLIYDMTCGRNRLR
jgi:hypothetical protein